MIFIPIAFAIFLWIGGYLITAGNLIRTGIYSDAERKLITPPKWLYYSCGAPVSKAYQKGSLSVVAFRTQMGGIFLGIYLIWYVITKPPTSVNAVGFGVSMLISYLITAYVSKRYCSTNQTGIRKR